MDKINPFTNAPASAPGQPAGAPGAPVPPPKPQEKKPKSDFSIKPLLRMIFLIIIGVVIAKLAFDSLVQKPQPQPKPQAPGTRQVPQPAAQKAAVPPRAAAQKGKTAAPLTLSDQFAAAKQAAKPAQQPSGEQYMLSGIFLSPVDGMSSAIVNNRVVQVGDSVDGAVVQSITMEGIELHKDDLVIKLRNK